MFFRQLGSLLATIAVCYAALLACYLITCLVVTRLNRRAIKIQSTRQTPISHIKRDLRQSVVSLAFIAGMLGAGHWIRWHFLEGRAFTDPGSVAEGIARGLRRMGERGLC